LYHTTLSNYRVTRFCRGTLDSDVNATTMTAALHALTALPALGGAGSS